MIFIALFLAIMYFLGTRKYEENYEMNYDELRKKINFEFYKIKNTKLEDL